MAESATAYDKWVASLTPEQEAARVASMELADQEMMADVYRRTAPSVHPSGELGILPYIGATRPSTYEEEGPAKYKTLVVGPSTPHDSGIAAVYFGRGNPVNAENEIVKSTGYPLPSQALIRQGLDPLKPEEIYLQQFTPDYLDARIQTEKKKGVKPSDLEERRADPVFQDPAATLLHEFFHRAVDSPWYSDFQNFTEENLSVDDAEAVKFPTLNRSNNERVADTIDQAARGNPEASRYNKERLKRIDGALRKFFTPERQEVYGVRLPLKASEPQNEGGLIDVFTTISAFIPSKIKEFFRSKTNEEYFNSAEPMANGGIVHTNPKAQAYAQGALEAVPTAVNYFREAVPNSGPFGLPTATDLVQGLMRVGIDARNLVGGMGQAAADDPVATALDFTPGIAETRALMDADNLMEEALAAEEAGEADKASTLRQLATVSVLGGLPFVPKVGKLARKAKGKTPQQLSDEVDAALEKANKNFLARKEQGRLPQPPVETPPPPSSALQLDPNLSRGEQIDMMRKANAPPPAPLSRLDRAKAQNYETDRVLYHGTHKRWPETEATFIFPDTKAAREAGLHYDGGPYLTPDIGTANKFANRFINLKEAPQPNVVPVYVKGPGLKIEDRSGPFGSRMRIEAAEKLGISIDHLNVPKQIDAILKAAKDAGYGYLEMDNVADMGRVAPQVIPLGGDKVRSIYAQFDPKRANESNLDYASGGIVSL